MKMNVYEWSSNSHVGHGKRVNGRVNDERLFSDVVSTSNQGKGKWLTRG